MKSSLVLVLLTLLILTACNMNSGTPTPTIVPLVRTPTVQNEAQVDSPPPTITPIPFPSPTPTQTPFLVQSSEAAIAATSLPAPSLTPLLQTTSLPQAEVIVAALNVRQGPGVDYPVINAASAGDVFDVVAVDPSGTWLRVAIDDGDFGWISGQMPYTRLLASGLDNVRVADDVLLPVETSNKTTTGSGKLIFMTGSGGNLYSVNIDGSELRRLTGGVIDPVVSMDGRQVAFTRWDGAEFGSVHVINVDGSAERVVKGDIRQPKSPAWSPDGQQLVVSYQHGGLRDPDEKCNYYSRGTFSGFSNRVTVNNFTVNRDGSINVCFTPFEDLHWKLARIDVSTGAFEDLPSDQYSYNPTWDPQNPWRVLYDGEAGLVQLDVNRGNWWPLTEDLRDTGPVFSPDGTMLTLTYKQHDHWEVYTLDMQTGARQRLTKPPILADPQYNSASPAWSPDGQKLVFVSDRTGQWEIWAMNVDGSNQHPLFPLEMQAQLNLQYNGVNERMLNWVE